MAGGINMFTTKVNYKFKSKPINKLFNKANFVLCYPNVDIIKSNVHNVWPQDHIFSNLGQWRPGKQYKTVNICRLFVHNTKIKLQIVLWRSQEKYFDLI